LVFGAAAAQTYSTADELIAAVDARPEPATMQATLTMVITTANGQKLSRQMTTWSAGADSRIIKFTAPADIAGSGFLTLTAQDGSEERLVYLPALDRVRRIAGGQQGDAFFGSDFSYEDITGIDQDDYNHKLLEVRDGPVYMVEAVPTATSGSSYERLVLQVPEATLLPERVEYYRGGQLAKVLTVSGLTEVDGYTVATERRMQSMVDGKVSTFTVITQSDIVLDADLPADLFTERFLRR
jgi:hypothetical protein